MDVDLLRQVTGISEAPPVLHGIDRDGSSYPADLVVGADGAQHDERRGGPAAPGRAVGGYASTVLGPLLVSGAGIGLSLPPSMNTGTFGVAPGDAGVASATLNVGQQIGGSIGTALLNTVATSAAATYLTSHLSAATTASPQAGAALQAAAVVHGYTTAFWWTVGIFAAGGIFCGALLRLGPLARQAQAAPPDAKAPQPEPVLRARH